MSRCIGSNFVVISALSFATFLGKRNVHSVFLRVDLTLPAAAFEPKAGSYFLMSSMNSNMGFKAASLSV